MKTNNGGSYVVWLSQEVFFEIVVLKLGSDGKVVKSREGRRTFGVKET